ncbi:helix-turn-helix domain-containing protein [Pseudomonas phytophila]
MLRLMPADFFGGHVMSFESSLGSVLRDLRIRRGWTQAHFDGVVSAQYLSDLEFGKRAPSLTVLRGICAHIGVELPTVLILAAARDDVTLEAAELLHRVGQEIDEFK